MNVNTHDSTMLAATAAFYLVCITHLWPALLLQLCSLSSCLWVDLGTLALEQYVMSGIELTSSVWFSFCEAIPP